MVSTRAPIALANWMTYWLTDPAPPDNQQGGALAGAGQRDRVKAVIAGMPRQAPDSKLMLCGSLTACAAGSAIYSRGGAEGALPLPVTDPHPLADARGGDAVADLVDDAGAVAVRDDARPGDLAVGALARFDVGRVDTRGRKLDANLAGAGLRRFDLGRRATPRAPNRSARNRRPAWLISSAAARYHAAPPRNRRRSEAVYPA